MARGSETISRGQMISLVARRRGHQGRCDGRSPPSGRRRRRRHGHRLLLCSTAAAASTSAASAFAVAASAASAPFGSDKEGGDASLRVAVVVVHSVPLPCPCRAASRVEVHRAYLAGKPDTLPFPVGLHARPNGQGSALPRQEAGRL